MATRSSRLDDYLDERVHELGSLGGEIQEVDLHEFGDSASIHAFIAFGSDGSGLLTVFEFVRMDEREPRTRRYAYQGTCDGDFLFRFDYDPIGRPAMPGHKHLRGGGEPVPCERVTLETAVDELRAHLAARRGGDA
jgi:hypothetical protein